jgi:hypothetical protein
MNKFSNEIKKMIDDRDAGMEVAHLKFIEKLKRTISFLENQCITNGIPYKQCASKK